MKGLRKEGTAHDPKLTASYVQHGGDSVMALACMAATGTGSPAFIDVTAEGSSRMNAEVYRNILSAQIQEKASNLIGQCFFMRQDNDPKTCS